MFKWMGQKVMNARLTACIKEVSWEIRDADGPSRARFHLYATMWMDEMNHSGFPIDALENPIAIGPAIADQLYQTLEDVRNAGIMQHDAMQKNMRRMGIDPKDAGPMTDEVLYMRRGLELIMICFAAGVLTEKLYEVASIWRNLLTRSASDENAAIERVLSDAKLALSLGTGGNYFSHKQPEDLSEMIRYSPAFLSNVATG